MIKAISRVLPLVTNQVLLFPGLCLYHTTEQTLRFQNKTGATGTQLYYSCLFGKHVHVLVTPFKIEKILTELANKILVCGGFDILYVQSRSHFWICFICSQNPEADCGSGIRGD